MRVLLSSRYGVHIIYSLCRDLEYARSSRIRSQGLWIIVPPRLVIHNHPTTPATPTSTPTTPKLNPTTFFFKNPVTLLNPSGSGSTKSIFLPTTKLPSGGCFGSKQYLVKHSAQISDRMIGGEDLYRARSTEAHWRQTPHCGSAAAAFSRKPEMVFVCVWSMKRRLCLEVYWIWNVPVL